MPLLEVDNVSKRFGGIVALDAVSLSVEAGEIVGLIGPNGAGKTTVFNVITRLYTPDAGDRPDTRQFRRIKVAVKDLPRVFRSDPCA